MKCTNWNSRKHSVCMKALHTNTFRCESLAVCECEYANEEETRGSNNTNTLCMLPYSNCEILISFSRLVGITKESFVAWNVMQSKRTNDREKKRKQVKRETNSNSNGKQVMQVTRTVSHTQKQTERYLYNTNRYKIASDKTKTIFYVCFTESSFYLLCFRLHSALSSRFVSLSMLLYVLVCAKS